jgi:mono/diheme cytochrome c family protein
MLRRLACLLIVVPATAWSQDVEQGHLLAAQWCANCHVVERTTATGAATASANGLPTFPAIAASPRITPELLRATMSASHGRMPDLQLSKRQQDDLIAYIQSLRRKQ